MNEEMLKAVIELIQNGGVAAVWITVVYMLIGLLKYMIGFGAVYYIITRLYRLIKGFQ